MSEAKFLPGSLREAKSGCRSRTMWVPGSLALAIGDTGTGSGGQRPGHPAGELPASCAGCGQPGRRTASWTRGIRTAIRSSASRAFFSLRKYTNISDSLAPPHGETMNYRTSLYASVVVSRALRHCRARREERLRLHLTCRGAAEPRGASTAGGASPPGRCLSGPRYEGSELGLKHVSSRPTPSTFWVLHTVPPVTSYVRNTRTQSRRAVTHADHTRPDDKGRPGLVITWAPRHFPGAAAVPATARDWMHGARISCHHL